MALNLKCVFCQKYDESLILFTDETLKKCRVILKHRKIHNLKYKDVMLPTNALEAGFHRRCYKSFTGLVTKSSSGKVGAARRSRSRSRQRVFLLNRAENPAAVPARPEPYPLPVSTTIKKQQPIVQLDSSSSAASISTVGNMSIDFILSYATIPTESATSFSSTATSLGSLSTVKIKKWQGPPSGTTPIPPMPAIPPGAPTPPAPPAPQKAPRKRTRSKTPNLDPQMQKAPPTTAGTTDSSADKPKRPKPALRTTPIPPLSPTPAMPQKASKKRAVIALPRPNSLEADKQMRQKALLKTAAETKDISANKTAKSRPKSLKPALPPTPIPAGTPIPAVPEKAPWKRVVDTLTRPISPKPDTSQTPVLPTATPIPTRTPIPAGPEKGPWQRVVDTLTRPKSPKPDTSQTPVLPTATPIPTGTPIPAGTPKPAVPEKGPWQRVVDTLTRPKSPKPDTSQTPVLPTATPIPAGTPVPPMPGADGIKSPGDQIQPGQQKRKRKKRTPKDDCVGRVFNVDGLDPESLFFRDGKRKIDIVLAYEEDPMATSESEIRKRAYRKTFHENLEKEGLELELEDKCLSWDHKTWFLKIHIPRKTELKVAELIGMKMPTKRFITIPIETSEQLEKEKKNTAWYLKCYHRLRKLYEFEYTAVTPEPSFYGAEQRWRRRDEIFILKDRHTNFSSAQRSLLVMQILARAKYDNNSTKMGIMRLLKDTAYSACFPLHEGRYERNMSDGTVTDRRLLYLEWARLRKWYKQQPLWLVRRYFGDKIAVYFCWLGFYTRMLVPAAVVGTCCFIYGLTSMDSDDNIPSKEICDPNGPGNSTLCPLCDKACKYLKLSDSCLFANLTYLFDNPATVFFAVFMSFWATSFLEFWKRKQSVLKWEWDLSVVDQDEFPRPEFETAAKTFRTNPVTREQEPYLSTGQKTFKFIISGSAVLFCIAIVVTTVLGIIVYRVSMVTVIYGGSGYFIQSHAKLFTTMTAAIINLIIIMIMTRIYGRIALYLTNIENPRTQTEYEDSYTFKIFFFDFINFYASLIYIAFFKGRFYDHPGDDQARRSQLFKLKGDVCDPAGCLTELCIQLAIIMIGKQFFNHFIELGNPKVYNWLRWRSHKAMTMDPNKPHMAWEQDYHLHDAGRLALFDDYLEMIIQYGFVTLFVAAFPLAPLFALLNNIAEIRLDAYKMVTLTRRPLAQRVEDIGAWFGVLKAVTYLAVVSNGLIHRITKQIGGLMILSRTLHFVGIGATGTPQTMLTRMAYLLSIGTCSRLDWHLSSFLSIWFSG
ncbi:anoctamin-5 isoform X2 [Spodoptera frugiperda]|uniref:Anoctamin n=1 Tax=Spodoptera frugiperda TaxID=7108 RepID=A0A9R0ETJ6_SPOFR|nr:anoctamin-5 isoform X2 [Spodoptera frugiperda]